MVRLGVLTSSRADFGVYLPLLETFKKDSAISLEIVAFGTHLSNLHGNTIKEIIESGFNVKYRIITTFSNDSAAAVSGSIALTALKFAEFWSNHSEDFDLVLCLGDRYEMFAAVLAGVPFGIKFAHFYGGDFSKGAIDNVFRNGMTNCSSLHFTSTKRCAERVKVIAENPYSIDVVGILSLSELDKFPLLSLEQFKDRWGIDLSLSTILVTIHPETISPERNSSHAQVINEVISKIVGEFQLVITMPNSDTNGDVFRQIYEESKQKFPDKIYLIENFGIQSYFTCMKHCLLMLGNTSSGISEAASFKKYFINVGDRQIGREFGSNVISIPFDDEKIINEIHLARSFGKYLGANIYSPQGSLENIVKRIKLFVNEII
jgi:GDP/UDP-N,N'-diacetylbacillosamine 2-epimerase (hydrolysing)